VNRSHLVTGVAASAIAAVAALSAATPARAQFGELAPGAALSWSLAGVHMEAGVTFVMDPSFVAGRLPRGFQPYTLREVAAGGDSAARATLAGHPDFGDHVIATLGVARLDSLAVEGEPTGVRPLTVAFWWVPVRPADTTASPPDARARSGSQLVELGFWAADPHLGQRLHSLMPTAASAPVTVTWDGAGSWRIRIPIPDGMIVGRCRPVGSPTPASYKPPQFSTVWGADSVPGPLAVFTFYGHLLQPCEGSWRATGEAPLARALRTGAILSVGNQIGWRARAAAYPRR
jgi:hypothetical protein